MQQFWAFAISILSSAAVSAALAGAVIWLGRSWIGERLRASIKHEYEQKIVALNAELKSRGDAQIEIMKASMEREAERIRFAASSFGEAQRSAIERKLAGVDTLWAGVLRVRDSTPPIVMGFMDVLTVDEYQGIKDHPTFQALSSDLSEEGIAEMFKDSRGSLERVRPYVGEYLWAVFATYQALMTRLVLLLHWGKTDAQKLDWHQDDGIQKMLQSSLSQDEKTEFEQMKFGKIGWMQRKFETKILAAMENVISGKQFGEEALKQAELMEAQVQNASREAIAALRDL